MPIASQQSRRNKTPSVQNGSWMVAITLGMSQLPHDGQVMQSIVARRAGRLMAATTAARAGASSLVETAKPVLSELDVAHMAIGDGVLAEPDRRAPTAPPKERLDGL
jgi:hypothetical protein